MQVKTGFDLHDQVWLVWENKLQTYLVSGIEIFILEKSKDYAKAEIIYRLKKQLKDDEHIEVMEDSLFRNREEYIKSL